MQHASSHAHSQVPHSHGLHSHVADSQAPQSHAPSQVHPHSEARSKAPAGTGHPAADLHTTSLTGGALNRLAWMATLHCLMGCAIGEVAGLVIGTALGWSNAATIALAVALAFVSGFALTALPLLRSGLAPRQALRLALAADTVSITIMEIVDNGIMLAIPGAMEASIDSLHFWVSMVIALSIAALAAWPVNRWLIARGRGHAAVHSHH